MNYKNLLPLSLLVILFFAVLPASAYSTIPSGDFDTNSSWTQSITGSGTNGHITFYTSGSYDDSAYAYLYAKGRYSDGDLDRDYYTYTDLIQTVDVTGKDTLYFYAKYYEHDDTYSYAVGRVYVGNRSVYMDTDNVWKLYSLDVSMLEGEQELKVEAYAKGDYSWEDYATAYLYVDHFYFDNDTDPTAESSSYTGDSGWWVWFYTNVLSSILTNGLFSLGIAFLLLAGLVSFGASYFIKKDKNSLKAPNDFFKVSDSYQGDILNSSPKKSNEKFDFFSKSNDNFFDTHKEYKENIPGFSSRKDGKKNNSSFDPFEHKNKRNRREKF
ncbi:hypothetical protein MSSAC_2390 [Methanosarcina siciliae C2J]|uniref:Uncharacterized protein n=1 Tax=Methanosarcina siciliae C2J TaxID=1434118 RepID=A0A0E3PP32_9EURY|nr:hypothetical protein [Methanosarcina siciliae]AKB36980.1 hypothetical protein MSSAC_2390 [Methanosarcina siciliae C2J]